MSQTSLTAFESTLQTTNIWLHDIENELGWDDTRRAYHALRVVLHTLRDRMTVEQAAALAAQLPLLVRGIFFEGWHPHGKPLKERHRRDFLAHIARAFEDDGDVDAAEVTAAVFAVLRHHLSGGEVTSIIRGLPAELQMLWL